MKLKVAEYLPSLCRTRDAARETLRIALVQFTWRSKAEEHRANIENGIRLAQQAGAQMVFLPELTLSRYPADVCPTGKANQTAESLHDGPTFLFFSELARELCIHIQASLYEATDSADGRSLNTAIIINNHGQLVGRTRKLHIPVTEGYFEDKYFQEGPNTEPYPTYRLVLPGSPDIGVPTCWDQWFPEVARAYGLTGADLLCYPTAIGSEPDHPDFDTEPLWRQTIIGHAIANGLFIVVPNRSGDEGIINFYGSSFIVDPYGRVLIQAAREGDEVLVADIDFEQRRDWLELFPFFGTRRPDTYSSLVDPRINERTSSGQGTDGGIPGLKLK